MNSRAPAIEDISIRLFDFDLKKGKMMNQQAAECRLDFDALNIISTEPVNDHSDIPIQQPSLHRLDKPYINSAPPPLPLLLDASPTLIPLDPPLTPALDSPTLIPTDLALDSPTSALSDADKADNVDIEEEDEDDEETLLIDDYGFYYDPSSEIGAEQEYRLHFNFVSNMKKHRRMELKWLSIFDRWETTNFIDAKDVLP